MAEGPKVVKWARALRPLIGRPLVRVGLPRKYQDEVGGLVGLHVTALETRGSHLLVRLSSGQALHCQGTVDGYWDVRPADTPPPCAQRGLLARLCTEKHEALFLNGHMVDLLTFEAIAQDPCLTALGPDVMSPHFDREQAWRRVHAYGGRIAEAILDEGVVAGMGNVHKCEGLFLAGSDPFRLAAEISRNEVEALWDVLIPLMWEEANSYGPWSPLPKWLRETGEKHWVFGRGGRPCLRCDTRVRFTRQGAGRRMTFYCPRCQR